jgi:ABC-type transport system involved in cytochrome c biogenesis ATPase subunit
MLLEQSLRRHLVSGGAVLAASHQRILIDCRELELAE